jgi:tripartite-type tricarboxylate transporter receptor subunit TctC
MDVHGRDITVSCGRYAEWRMMRQNAIVKVIIAALALGVCIGVARPESFPTRPVTFIVPWGVGGTTDFQLRALAAASERHLGQPFVIENRPSANGTLGPAQMAANARPDGYTITQIHTGVLRLPFMARTTYDPATDFTYIIGISGLTAGLVVRRDAPWKDFAELLADAKANPGKITYGAPAGAVNSLIVMKQIAKRQNIEWTHVPFKSFAESSNALLGGHIHAVSDAAGWAPLVNAGQLRLLVTYGSSRTKNWPMVPTLPEFGIDVVASSAYGLAGPKGMHSTIVGILHDAFKKGMEEPAFVNVLKQLEQEPLYQSTEDYRAYITRELATQKRIVDELGLKPQ